MVAILYLSPDETQQTGVTWSLSLLSDQDCDQWLQWLQWRRGKLVQTRTRSQWSLCSDIDCLCSTLTAPSPGLHCPHCSGSSSLCLVTTPTLDNTQWLTVTLLQASHNKVIINQPLSSLDTEIVSCVHQLEPGVEVTFNISSGHEKFCFSDNLSCFL